MRNVKGVTCSDKPTKNHPPTLQLPSALQSFLASFSSLFGFTACNLCFGSLSPLTSTLFPAAAGNVRALINSLYSTCPITD